MGVFDYPAPGRDFEAGLGVATADDLQAQRTLSAARLPPGLDPVTRPSMS